MSELSNPFVNYNGLGSWLVVMMDRNTGMVRTNPRVMTIPIIEWLQDEGCYCLDAPDKLPGGSCYNDVLNCFNGGFVNLYQTAIRRE